MGAAREVPGAEGLSLWHPTDRDRERLETWVALAGEAHEHFVFTPNERVNRARPRAPIWAARVALVTTAGVHLRRDPPFDVKSPRGDPTFREIPATATHGELMVSDTHFNSEGAERDINCLFPIERLRGLTEQGTIGEVAPTHFGFMGFNPSPDPDLLKSGAEVAGRLEEEDVDVVLMTPG